MAGYTQPSESWTTDYDVRKSSWNETPEPKPRNRFVRLFFVQLWPVVFFIAAALTMTELSGAFSAKTAELQKQLQQQSAEKHTWWILLASLLLYVLGCVGVLPWTGAKRK